MYGSQQGWSKDHSPFHGSAVLGVKGMFLVKMSWCYLHGFSLAARQVAHADEAEATGVDSCPWIPGF